MHLHETEQPKAGSAHVLKPVRPDGPMRDRGVRTRRGVSMRRLHRHRLTSTVVNVGGGGERPLAIALLPRRRPLGARRLLRLARRCLDGRGVAGADGGVGRGADEEDVVTALAGDGGGEGCVVGIPLRGVIVVGLWPLGREGAHKEEATR